MGRCVPTNHPSRFSNHMGLCPEVKCWRVWGRGFPTVSLLRGGHGEGDALRRRLLPLLRDRLDLGEELHAGLACHPKATTHVSSSRTQLFQVGKVHSDGYRGRIRWPGVENGLP